MWPIIAGFLLTTVFAVFVREWRLPILYVAAAGTLKHYLKVRRRRLAAFDDSLPVLGPRLVYSKPEVQPADQSAYEQTVGS